MASPANIFALEAPLLARLKALESEVYGLTTGAAITLVGSTNVSAFLPGIFVRPLGSGTPEPVGDTIQETQRWEVIGAVQAIADKQNLATTYEALGRLLHRIVMHLHNWTAPDIGTLEYVGRGDPVEIPGHVEVTLTFSITTLIDLADGTALADFLLFYPTYDLAADGDADASDKINLPGP